MILALATAALAAPLAAGLVAERINEENAARRLIGGPDAIAGVGDWYLANELVEFVVDDVGRRHGKLNHGGTLVDAGLRDRRGEDQLARLFPVVNLDQRVQIDYAEAFAEVDPDGGWARVVVSSPGMSSTPTGGALWRRLHPLVPEPDEIAAVAVETEYRVQPGEPWVQVTTRFHNRGRRTAPIFAYGDVWMRGGRSIRAFVGNTRDPHRSPGSRHRGFDPRQILTAGDAMAGYTYVAAAGLPGQPPITYALASPELVAEGRLLFGVTGPHVTLANVFLRDTGWEALGPFRLLLATRAGLAPGAHWSIRRRLLVAGRSSVSAATDVLFPLLGVATPETGIEGRVEPAGVRAVVHVATADGAPVTQIAVATGGPERGRYRAVLPPGEYRLLFRAPHRPERSIAVSVPPDSFAEVAAQDLGEVAWLVFAGAAEAPPTRIVVKGLDGTPDPRFQPELLDFRIDGRAAPSASETHELHRLGGGRDPERVAIAPGRYRLYATRGPEYDLASVDVVLAGPGDEVSVPPLAPRRVIELPHAASADLHVHAAASDDSGTSNAARLREFVAAGVDWIAATDHDHVADYGPALAELAALGLPDAIRVIHGVEVTSATPSPEAPWTLGHHSAWPIPRRPLAHRGGAPASQGLRVADLYAQLRQRDGVRVIQLDHPFGREPGVSQCCFLTHLGSAGEPFDASRPIAAWPNRLLLDVASDGRTRAVDFDAIEVMNGSSWYRYLAAREAWHALLAQGFRPTATGNSDTHGPGEVAGYPRNYVELEPGATPEQFDAALRSGRSFATTGPLLLDFQVAGARMGELVQAPGGAAEVSLAVAAAPWVPLDEVRILVNGKLARRLVRLPPPGPDGPRFEHRERLRLARDAFVGVEAGASLEIDPDRWRAERGGVYASLVAPGFVSQLVANPVFVDVDGNGRFDPPGVGGAAGGAATVRLLVSVTAVLLLAVVWWRLRRRVERAR